MCCSALFSRAAHLTLAFSCCQWACAVPPSSSPPSIHAQNQLRQIRPVKDDAHQQLQPAKGPSWQPASRKPKGSGPKLKPAEPRSSVASPTRDVSTPELHSAISKPVPSGPGELFAGHNVSGETSEVLADLYRQQVRMQTLCQGSPIPGNVAGIFTDDTSRVAYCFLPKAGCTFWIRVFSYLHNFTGDSARTPWEIPRLKVHNTKHSHGVLWSAVSSKVQSYLRFMFVRHPFSRLWSAYLDKLFLPDFWREVGVPAVQALRSANTTLKAWACGHDLTFPEFVQFSLTTHEPHWEPIYLHCDPCQFRPAVVGDMRTFSKDTLFLLRRMGLEWVMKDQDHDDQEENELTTLVTYNFDRVRSMPFYDSCIDNTTLTRLLWKAFQLNGYISDDVPYPALPPGVVSVKEFQAKVLGAFRAAWPRRKELKLQKRKYLQQALASLPASLMAAVKIKYMPDMVYFGFNDTNY
ncbi:hypothetical protein ACOMHN_004768 [Nucella lapillus]